MRMFRAVGWTSGAGLPEIGLDEAARLAAEAADELQRAISEGLALVVTAGSCPDGQCVPDDVAERIALVRARMRRAELILAEFSTT